MSYIQQMAEGKIITTTHQGNVTELMQAVPIVVVAGDSPLEIHQIRPRVFDPGGVVYDLGWEGVEDDDATVIIGPTVDNDTVLEAILHNMVPAMEADDVRQTYESPDGYRPGGGFYYGDARGRTVRLALNRATLGDYPREAFDAVGQILATDQVGAVRYAKVDWTPRMQGSLMGWRMANLIRHTVEYGIIHLVDSGSAQVVTPDRKRVLDEAVFEVPEEDPYAWMDPSLRAAERAFAQRWHTVVATRKRVWALKFA